MPASAESSVERTNIGEKMSEVDSKGSKTKAQLKAERKAAFEAQRKLIASKEGSTAAKTKSKAELRAERRALQEAQRAAKALASQQTGDESKKKLTENTDVKEGDFHAANSSKSQIVSIKDKQCNDKIMKEQLTQHSSAGKKNHDVKDKIINEEPQHIANGKVRLFSHLNVQRADDSIMKDLVLYGSSVHPAIVRLGLQTRQGIVSDSNERCVAMLAAFKEVIQDYITPPQKELSRDLEAKLKSYMNFLGRCRPLSVSMVNAAKFLTRQITHIPTGTSDIEAKDQLCKSIHDFIHVEIVLAQEAISRYANEKISDGDVIMTFVCSSLVRKVLCDAYKNGKKFRVIVVDSRPKLQGKAMAESLAKAKIPCHYVLINAISSVMREVTSVILGAHALQANGYVMAHIGSSQVALVARAYNVPVLVCCETYKFCELVHTDSFVHNELGNPGEMINAPSSVSCLSERRNVPSQHILNLLYDLTPPDFVSMVITEKDKLPCTSVPVVLRVKHAGLQDT